MAQQTRSCDDCGVTVHRAKPKGQIPKRCQPCHSTRRNVQTADWRRRNPDALTRATRKRTATNQAARGQLDCPVCSIRFTPKRARSTTCSRACGAINRSAATPEEAQRIHRRRTEARQNAAANPLCEWCDTNPKRTDDDSGRPARFCSTHCMRAWHSAARRHLPSRRHGHGNYEHKQRTLAHGRVSPGVTWTEWRHILEFYGHRCAYCASTTNLEQDHLTPVARGGLHEPANVVPACRICNRSKGDRTLDEWRPGLSIERMAFA